MDERERRIESIYQDALDVPAGERAAFLDRACGDDAELRGYVERLLRHHDSAPDDFLVGERERQQLAPSDFADGLSIETLIGEGGMGSVYRAQQTRPIERTVAVKVIKSGLASGDMLARFHAERRSLALMSHPSIAQVYDAGTTHDGRPFFVMEYVPGEAITDYCNAHGLDNKERIRLFMQVCEAIHHAHQKGVIHRDIKPNNVIVSRDGARAIPKVIDFGIAKIVSPDGEAPAGVTRRGEFVGTPEYMSPEHASQQDADTRTDIYSLGMLLYEILVGAMPFDSDTFRERGLEEMIRMIRLEEAPRPSERVLATAAAGGALRTGDARSIARALRGDLDWIIMKAVEKDRERRYSSASELARDLERYLDNEAVLARPPSTTYRMHKFVRRHRLGVGIAAISAAALVGIVIVTAVQSQRVRRESQRVAAEAALSREVSDYLANMFHSSGVRRDLNAQVLLSDALDVGAATLLDDDSAAPSAKARIRLARTLGDAYRSLVIMEDARALLERSYELALAEYGPDHIETADSGFLLAQAKMVDDRNGDYSQEFGAALTVYRRELGDDDAKTLTCERTLAVVLSRNGRFAEAVEHFNRIRAEYDGLYGSEHPRYALLLSDFATSLYHSGAYLEAIDNARHAIAVLDREYGESSLVSQVPLISLTHLYRLHGDLDAAQATAVRWRAQNTKARKPFSRRLAQVENHEAWIELRRGDAAAAVEGFSRAIRTYRETDSTYIGSAYAGMADALIDLGELERAGSYAAAAVRAAQQTFGDAHAQTAMARVMLARAELANGRSERAASLMTLSLEAVRTTFPPGHPYRVQAEAVHQRVSMSLREG